MPSATKTYGRLASRQADKMQVNFDFLIFAIARSKLFKSFFMCLTQLAHY